MEQEIEMEREAVVISAGGAVDSVNGMTGDVVLTTSDIENTSDYQTGTEVDTAIETAIAGIDIPTNTSDLNNDSDYQTGTEVDSAIATAIAGIDIPTKTSDLTNDGANGTSTYVEATALANEVSAREGADNGLQSQIDALAAASDVTDVVGTKAALEAYDTSTLKDNDIIKVLQDESEDGATTYYRWSTTTQTFTLIGEEGPYYTKAAADAIFDTKADKSTTYTKTEIDTALAAKQDALTAGANITIDANNEISATDTTYSDFTGTDGTADGTQGLVPAPTTSDADKYLKSDGTWDEVSAGPTVVQTTGTSTTDVMSQAATSKTLFSGRYLNGWSGIVRISSNSPDGQFGTGVLQAVGIGANVNVSGNNGTAVGPNASAASAASVALGYGAAASAQGQFDISTGSYTTAGYDSSNYRLLTGLYDPQSDHDAATKGYVDGLVGDIESALNTINNGSEN